MASAHNSSDPAPTCQKMASVQISSDPAPECQTMALEHGSLSPGRNCQENVSHRDKTGTTSNELDLLFSLMFHELLNRSSKVVSKSSAVFAADAPNQRKAKRKYFHSKLTPSSKRRSKDETPEVLIDFLRLVQRGLQAQVRVVRTDKGTEFLNQTLHAYFDAEGIQHQTDGENLDKMKEKGDECIFVGYSTQSRAYRVFNMRTRVIMESIHVNFDEFP
nr:integrase, catalytic region, zinc finger, CCHC-type, peptidase aspartic, catalytic [Tanacetum cinerariifolium]